MHARIRGKGATSVALPSIEGGMLPRRTVVCAEALAWLDANPAAPGSSVITSLPDVSELGGVAFDAWRAWFILAARRVIRWVPADGVAIFYQSDIRHRGAWVDKGHLVHTAADEEGAHLLWHKIVCRKPAGTLSQGRATYSHMLCVAHALRDPPRKPSADVVPDAGLMPWSKAMGAEACRVACRYLQDETATRIVVDPFCGRGTALAVANACGLEALGIELNAGRCRSARNLTTEAWPGWRP